MRLVTIPTDKIIVSDLNIRVSDKFGEAPEDQALTDNIRKAGVKQLITVRPKGDKYEVILGRRRFLSLRTSGAKKVDCVVREEWNDREALKASLIENMQNFQKPLDPVTRAEALNRLLSMSTKDMQGVAHELRIPKSTLSEYLKVLELNPKLKEQVQRQVVPFKEAVRIARLKLGEDLQDNLAEIAVDKGLDALRNETARLEFGKKRGAPRGLLVIRLVFDHRNMEDKKHYEALMRLGGGEYCKSVLIKGLNS